MARKVEHSEFLAWFTAQYGKRPSNKSLAALRNEHLDLECRAADAKNLTQAVNRWELLRDAALKGWCARDKNTRKQCRRHKSTS